MTVVGGGTVVTVTVVGGTVVTMTGCPPGDTSAHLANPVTLPILLLMLVSPPKNFVYSSMTN